MRVLVTSVSALGHVHPMVPLVRALLDRGHLIRWVTGPDAATRLRRLSIAVDPAGPPFEDLRAEYRRRYPEFASLRSDQVPDHVFPHLFGEIVSAALFEEDVRIARAWRPDLILHDAAEFAAPVAAAVVGVPSVTHAFGALTPVHRVSGAAELAAPLWRSVGLEPRPFGGLYDHLYLDIYPPSFEVEDMSHVPRRQPLRPVAFDDADDDPSVELNHAPGADPLVYVTLGTVIRDRSSLRVALEAIASHRVRVLVTVGPAGDPAELGPQPDQVRVERYVPQTRVLPHCAVVISHAGSGTFLATLSQGVPQLCLPHAADQFMNAAACRRSGAGLVLQPDEVSVPAIDRALSRLLSEERFRERAGAVRAEIAAMPGPNEIVPALEALANRS
jgi:UDP:flavonoid glycosyltransferase YjiC (YdhE family)